MVRIENASVAQFDNFLNTTSRRAVQVAFILAIFDKKTVFNVTVHLLAVEKMVIDPVSFANPRRT